MLVILPYIIACQTKSKVGETEINQLSGMSPPMFSKIGAEKFYADSIATVEVLLTKFDATINEAQRGR